MLAKWEATPRSRIAALARKGVPDKLRQPVWMLMTDAANPELEASYRLLSSQPSASDSVIKWDLERTFPAHEKFREKDGQGQRELSRVNTVGRGGFRVAGRRFVCTSPPHFCPHYSTTCASCSSSQAYANYDTEVGYCQGLSFITAVLLLQHVGCGC